MGPGGAAGAVEKVDLGMRLDFPPYRDSVTIHVAAESGNPVALADFDRRYPTFVYLRDGLERIVSSKTRADNLSSLLRSGWKGSKTKAAVNS